MLFWTQVILVRVNSSIITPTILLLKVNGTNTEDRFHITSGGNVGIGSDNPGDKLSISGGNLGIYNTGNNHGNVYFYRMELLRSRVG